MKDMAAEEKRFSRICVFFRKETFILFCIGVKLALRNEKSFFGKFFLPKKAIKRRESQMKNNQINVPQAKQAMEQFKMQAAQEEDVSSTS